MVQLLNDSPSTIQAEIKHSEANHKHFPHFNKDNARAYSIAYWDSVRKAKENPQPVQVVHKPAQDDSYLVERLARVRKQLNKVDRLIEGETDPQKLDRLASAQMRLSEQERILAGRPLPGSRKPAPDKPRRSRDDSPAPIAPMTPQAQVSPAYNPANDPNAPNG